jgi:probable O-glycosylation ligase (exosortase A-associated)
MRDLLVTLIVFASLPFIFKSPVNGALMWIWISVMNPHTQGWGFAANFPFAFIIAIVTTISLMTTKQEKNFPLTPVTATLIAFVLWMSLTMPFSIFMSDSVAQWKKVMKIMSMTFVCLMLVKNRKDVHRLIWVLVMSLGYYGVKGGIFTLRSGGSDKVWGPAGTFIEGNNEIALAMIMIIPLMYYLQQNSDNKWVRHGLTVAMLLSALAALGSYSRGAFLAIAAMLVCMWFKSDKKIAFGCLLALAIPPSIMFMPDEWGNRMNTISTYELDESAQGRINAWRMAYNLAKDRFFGGGFEIYNPTVFRIYAPNPNDIHAAHSNYFQLMGEHGFVGLGLYLLLGLLSWRCATWIIRHAKQQESLRWAIGLATMIQTSLIGFFVGGAFLSLAYFDVPYYLMIALVATRIIVEQSLLAPSHQELSMAKPSSRKHDIRSLVVACHATSPPSPRHPDPTSDAKSVSIVNGIH